MQGDDLFKPGERLGAQLPGKFDALKKRIKLLRHSLLLSFDMGDKHPL
jgi:hypothetical protein